MKVRDLPATLPVLRVLASRDLKVKYKQSALGPLWVVFQPLALLIAFLVAFKGLGDVQTGGVPYTVFALAGLSVWSYFQAAMTMAGAAMLSNLNLVRYTPCSRFALLTSGLVSSLPSLGITAGAAIISAAATGHLTLRVFLLPVGVAWLLLLTVGPVAVVASEAVRYRDVLNLLPFLLQLGTFVAPVGYALSGLSPTLRTIVEINPLTGLIEFMRWVIISGYRPNLTSIYISLGLMVVLTVFGWRTFTRRETTMADEI